MASKNAQAYRQIKRLIESGHVPAGERLTEAYAAKMVGLGRSPVHESLVRLEAEGLLKNTGSRQSRVVVYAEDQDPQDMLYRYEVREQIESAAARLAAKMLTGWEIDRLREFALTNDNANLSGDRKVRNEAAYKWHNFLLSHCGNPILLEIWKTHRLAPVQPRSRKFDEMIDAEILRNVKKSPSLSNVTEAIASHDPDLAENLMRQRLRAVTEALRKFVMKQAEDNESY